MASPNPLVRDRDVEFLLYEVHQQRARGSDDLGHADHATGAQRGAAVRAAIEQQPGRPVGPTEQHEVVSGTPEPKRSKPERSSFEDRIPLIGDHVAT